MQLKIVGVGDQNFEASHHLCVWFQARNLPLVTSKFLTSIENSLDKICNRHLAPPCFQQFHLPATPWAHVRNVCFPLLYE